MKVWRFYILECLHITANTFREVQHGYSLSSLWLRLCDVGMLNNSSYCWNFWTRAFRDTNFWPYTHILYRNCHVLRWHPHQSSRHRMEHLQVIYFSLDFKKLLRVVLKVLSLNKGWKDLTNLNHFLNSIIFFSQILQIVS